MKPFTTEFTLTRDYLAECYDESLPYARKPNVWLPLLAGAGGLYLLIFTSQPTVGGIALLALAVLELAHMRYRRAWWLFRQTMGKNANLQVTLTIDNDGIRTQSTASDTRLAWADIDRVLETEKGLILVQANGAQQYLSKALFTEEQIAQFLALNDQTSGNHDA
ncbi:YcxB family protein [Reinekea blandensis]|uniref:YcxB-like C-terminal domain-containing protein n=1 Tax=Reinekea blandensis MED297 TaxID=314283 RepID=A4BF19_9GAMM|nr:YcxB family protein [Reinekea blandensis]EAR09354.1 hypothetical protein MED297_18738 [Reinekea sp. MED297] [Reinekea blandensis MED297]